IQGTIANLHDEFVSAQESLRGLLDTQKKGALEGAEAANNLTRPYQDKLHELDAQLAGLKGRLEAIGRSSTAETLAASMLKAKEAVAKLNDELVKHHQHLTQKQAADITARFAQIGETEAEVEWKTKLDQTTTSITDRIQSLKLLTAAIGEGYEAQKRASVETQLFQTLGEKANDPEWMRTHQPDVTRLRTQIGSEYDAQRSEQTGKTLDQLSDQIELENKLAA